MVESPQDKVLEHNPTTGFYFVALLDVMGQSGWLERHLGPMGTEAQVRDAFAAVQTAVQPVVWLRRSAAMLHKALFDAQTEFASRHPGYVPYTPGFQSFGDTSVLFTRLYSKSNSEEISLKILGTVSCLNICARIVLQGLAKGFPLRGAVEYGVATDVFRDEIYGPALLAAYRLERCETGHMRIVVGPGLRGLLEAAMTPAANDAVPPEERYLARRAMSMIVKDQDNRLVIDYLGQTVRSSVPESEFIEAATEAHAFLLKAKHYMLSAGEAKIADKYSATLRYFASRGRVGIAGPWIPHEPRVDEPQLRDAARLASTPHI